MNIIDRIRRFRFVKVIEKRISKMIAIQLTKQRLDDLAYNSTCQGVDYTFYDDEELIVSLTTHGKRVMSVHRTIESVFNQSIKSNKVILYICDDEFQEMDELPLVLQKQVQRGLEIRFVKDLGPYTKLLYTLKDHPESNIVTIDDDILYPVNMLERLLSAHRNDKKAICGLAVRQLELKNNGKFIPYKNMKFMVSSKDFSSNMFVAEGFGGVLYPSHCFSDEVYNKEVFMKLAPKADDLWFWANAIIAGTPILCVHGFQPLVRELLIDDDVQDMGLVNDNFFGNGNDKQLSALCEHYHLYEKLK